MERNPKRIFITSVGVGLLLLMWIVTCLAKPISGQIWFSLLVLFLGSVIGGLIGALASPGASHEKDNFKSVAGVISAFLTGALWAAYQSEIKVLINAALATGTNAQVQSIAFVICVFLGGFVIYAYREYGGLVSDKDLETCRQDAIEAITKLTTIAQAVETTNKRLQATRSKQRAPEA